MFIFRSFLLSFLVSVACLAQETGIFPGVNPEGTRVFRRVVDTNFGFTELTFMNGVQIMLMPTDFRDDQVLFAGLSPGGKSIYLDEDFMSATMATAIVTRSGLGEWDSIALSNKLSGSSVHLTPFISEIFEGVSGWAAPADLETLLKLNYLYFTAARRDEEVFNRFILDLKKQTEIMRQDPMYVYLDKLQNAVTSNSPRSVIIPDEAQINRIRINHALNIYNDRFSDAGDFRFVMVGNFNVNTVTPMLETYLGGLPSRNRVETWRDEVMPQFPQGITVVNHSHEGEKSSVNIIMKGEFRWTPRERIQFEMFTEVLKLRLSDIMLEEEGKDYDINITGRVRRFPNPQYTLDISWTGHPENTDSHIAKFFDEVAMIKTFGTTHADLNRIKEIVIGEREKATEGNEFWIRELMNIYRRGDKLMTLQEYKRMVNSVKPRDFRRIARRYFDETNYVLGVLSPQI